MSLVDLQQILNNKTLGSSELTRMLNKYFLSIRNNQSEMSQTIKIAKKRLGQFEEVNSYLDDLKSILKKNDSKRLNQFLMSYSKKEDEKIQLIFDRIYPEIKKTKSVITLSRSGTVISILKLWQKRNKDLKVVVCESRPKFEGRLTAKDLLKGGISVELITDAMMGIYTEKVDFALIGADSILKNGNVINKVGSKALALFCLEKLKPFYVVSTKSKRSNKLTFNPKKEDPVEVWKKKEKNLTVSNYYFEQVEKNLITKIFTD
jgi:translation initiation factor eIF-2B subunit delta